MASYRVEVTKEIRSEVRSLPGNVRQRVMRVLRALEREPRPPGSRPLDPVKAGVDLEQGVELCRIRMASWRIVYLVEEERRLVSVLAIRQRPPYQYDDLGELVQASQ
jgi:mRNA-degrading endonuclease RelE of RelBE toxin-antitoxin system